MSTIELSADDHTEELVQYILNSIDESTLESMEVDRQIQRPQGLASEPVTIAVTLTLATVGVSAVVRLIERWMEHRRQMCALRIVASGFEVSEEAGKQLAKLAEAHAGVSVSFGIAKESWAK